MKSWFLLLIIFTNFLFHRVQAQITGVINQYTPVTHVSCNEIEVQNTSFLAVGDRVLIIQMKGAEINTSNTSAFGTIIDYHNCGRYEFATVSGISGNAVSFQYQLLNTYEVSGAVQLIRVPQYTDVTVELGLTAQTWNGSTGGVLVMEVSGTLTLNGPISTTGTGFSGSTSSMNPDGGCGNFTNYYYPVSSGYGAKKGEGIAEVSVAMDGGRGALANGGGGGNKHNSGGGGGSNGSKGGRGGDQALFCTQQPVGGEGGLALDYSNGRLFMGGGGGSPDFNDGFPSPGGDGGGIIIIRAATIQSNNMSISSNGIHIASSLNSMGDGGGGGGAGGTIALDVGSFSGQLTLSVNGGNGGDIQTTYPSCFGPGGGGGTGAIQISGSTLPALNVTTSFIPGDAGMNLSNPNCTQQAYGAESGQFGPIYSFNREFPESTQAFSSINIGPDIEVCEQSVTITTSILAESYLWSTGETTPSITVSTPGDYWLSVVYGPTSCSARDTISVNLNSLTVNAGPDQTVCMGDSVTLDASSTNNAATFNWSDGVVNEQPFLPQTTSVYTVVATSSNGQCTDIDSVWVTVNPLPLISVNPSVSSGCAPLTVSFNNTSTDCGTSIWTFSDGTSFSGCGNQSIVFENPGCYDLALEVTSTEGCIDSLDFDSLICVLASPVASFTPSPIILNSEDSITTMINHSVGGIYYEWNFGDGAGASDEFEPIYGYSTEVFGSYQIRLKVTNGSGCTDIAFATVYVEGGIVYYIPNAFTPDGNEFNQVFKPVFNTGLDPTEYNLRIFNRWGEVVFESNDPETGWDGTDRRGLVSDGVYTWRIEFGSIWNSEREVIHGHVNLLK